LFEGGQIPTVFNLEQPSYATSRNMKKIEAGGIIGHESFATEITGFYKTSAIAFNREDPTMLLRMDSEAYDLIVC
jgi:hypothetical protein